MQACVAYGTFFPIGRLKTFILSIYVPSIIDSILIQVVLLFLFSDNSFMIWIPNWMLGMKCECVE
jgi:hypothetical protein